MALGLAALCGHLALLPSSVKWAQLLLSCKDVFSKTPEGGLRRHRVRDGCRPDSREAASLAMFDSQPISPSPTLQHRRLGSSFCHGLAGTRLAHLEPHL